MQAVKIPKNFPKKFKNNFLTLNISYKSHPIKRNFTPYSHKKYLFTCSVEYKSNGGTRLNAETSLKFKLHLCHCIV